MALFCDEWCYVPHGRGADGSVNSVEAINYLTRYSNNLIAVSPLQSIDIAATEQSKASLFSSYIYEAA